MPAIDESDLNYIYFYVGKQIKKYRKLKGWSQSKLASECNFTNTFISNLENSTFQTISLNSLYLIAKTLEVPVKALFDGLEESKNGAVNNE